MINIPVILNNRYYNLFDKEKIISVDNEIIAEMSLFPTIKLHEIRNITEEKFQLMQSFPIHSILNDLKKAAEVFRQMDLEINGTHFNKETYIKLVSSSTGLPGKLVEQEITEITDIIENLENILQVQVPGDIESIFDHNEYFINNHKIGYFPAGKSLFIKIPGNIPTICLYWLIPFAQKRPIFLIPPKDDPFTHLCLIEAIKKVNPELASCISFLSCKESALVNLLHMSDQIIVPESIKKNIISPDVLSRTYFIHYGRTKILITEAFKDEYTDVIVRRMSWNCGRTCTGLTSLVVKEDANKYATQVSEKINKIYSNNIEQLASFKTETAEAINKNIDTYIAKGDAIDATQNLRGSARLIICEGKAVLLPTVLLVKNKKSEIFGLELPFPFITIIEAENEEEILLLSKNSLILSVITQDSELLKKLSYDSSILKIFAGKYIERGYHYMDPHEGYMADFLNRKKAVLY